MVGRGVEPEGTGEEEMLIIIIMLVCTATAGG